MTFDEIDFDDFEDRVLEGVLPVVLFAWSPEDEECEEYLRFILSLAEDFIGVPVLLHCDVSGNSSLAMDCGLWQTPTISVYHRGESLLCLYRPQLRDDVIAPINEVLFRIDPDSLTPGDEEAIERSAPRPATDSSLPEAKPRLLPKPAQMVAHLDRSIRGQTRAKQAMAVAVYNHFLSQAMRDADGRDLGRQHVLLLGPTGSGKTFIVRTIAEHLGVPVAFASATSLVEAGFRGRSPDAIIKSLLDAAGGNARLAERGIIFIDEIDKIRRQNMSGSRDVSGEGVQNALLTMLDGRIADNVDGTPHSPIDTSRILFVCTGAFVGLADIVRRRLGDDDSGSPMGFHTRTAENAVEIPDQPIYEALCQAQTSDLVEFGMIPEFIGRFVEVTALHELSKKDLRAIISEGTESSPLERQRDLARIHGIELVITPEALDRIAGEAARLGTGARGLARLIGRAVDCVDGRWPDLADAGVCRVTIGEDVVRSGAEPLIEKGPPLHRRRDDELRAACLAEVPPRPSAFLAEASSPPTLTDTSSWTTEGSWNALEELKRSALGWCETGSPAREWWLEFEKENRHRPKLLFRLAEELRNRGNTIRDFHRSFQESNTPDIQANLYYLDYRRAKAAYDARHRPRGPFLSGPPRDWLQDDDQPF